jgi:hypothetical protein
MARTSAGSASRITNYFQTASLLEAGVVFDIVKGIMKARAAEPVVVPAPVKVATRKTRKSARGVTATGAKRGRPRKSAPASAHAESASSPSPSPVPVSSTGNTDTFSVDQILGLGNDTGAGSVGSAAA